MSFRTLDALGSSACFSARTWFVSILIVAIYGCGGGTGSGGGEVLGDSGEQPITPEDGGSVVGQLSPGARSTGRLNDTGVLRCVAYNPENKKFSQKLAPCRESFDDYGALISPGQDGHYGRDVNQATNDSEDGRLGFDFTKIGGSGEVLSLAAPEWSCVLDNVTGLIWEVKSLSRRSLHYYKDKYTWYLSDGDKNGGVPGEKIYSGCYDYTDRVESSYCNAEAFIRRVNTSALCGRSNWRLPTVNELVSLKDYGSPGVYGVDIEFFPGSLAAGFYWSSETDAGRVRNAWAVELGEDAFANELDRSRSKRFSSYIRLVSK